MKMKEMAIYFVARALTSLLSHQVLILAWHTDALARIESRLAKNRAFHTDANDGDEYNAIAFVSNH